MYYSKNNIYIRYIKIWHPKVSEVAEFEFRI